MLEEMEDTKAAKEVENEKDILWEKVRKRFTKNNLEICDLNKVCCYSSCGASNRIDNSHLIRDQEVVINSLL